MKIMLIDDSQTMRNLQRGVLGALGYADIVEAVDGLDALAKVFDEEPSLILLDMNMPNLDGLGFLKAFRQEDKVTPVIMVTTEAEKPRVILALKNGANNYVVKPFSPDILGNKVKATLEKFSGAA